MDSWLVEHALWFLMELVEGYRGFDICRTNGGHFVMAERGDSRDGRFRLVVALARSQSLDALFCETMEQARLTIDCLIAMSPSAGCAVAGITPPPSEPDPPSVP